jgi:hypothetical protein
VRWGTFPAQQEVGMMKSKVVDLGKVRCLLSQLDKVRQHILSGGITGFQAVFLDSKSQETIFLGGIYQESSAMALKASLKLSAARTLTEDEPPQFANSSHS